MDEGVVLSQGGGKAVAAAKKVPARLVEGRLVFDQAKKSLLAFQISVAIEED
jgi:hypothetical protein